MKKSALLTPTTPRVDVAADMTLLEVLSLAETLKECERRGNIEPTNRVFVRSLHRLEEIALHTPEDRARVVLKDPRIQQNAPHLRRIMSLSEARAEKFHADESSRKTIPSCSPNATPAERINIMSTLLESYHRAPNYVKTNCWEMKLFKEIPLNSKSKVVFVGCGSVPLSSFLLHSCTNASVTCIDNDSEAVNKARKLADRLETAGILHRGKVQVIHADAQDFCYRDHDTVIVASLIPNELKNRIARQIGGSRKDPAQLTLRSGGDLVQLLYENVDPTGVVHDRLHWQAELQPWRRGSISVTEANHEPGRVRTIIGASEIFNSTQLYMANVGELPEISTYRPATSSEHNWSNKGSLGQDPRSIGNRGK